MRRVCSNCTHGAMHDGGVFCMVFHESVMETAAEECEVFDPVADPRTVSEVVFDPRGLAFATGDDEMKLANFHAVNERSTLGPEPSSSNSGLAWGLDAEEFAVLVDEFLLSVHFTLWGRAFDVHGKKGRQLATNWFVTQLEGLQEFKTTKEARSA